MKQREESRDCLCASSGTRHPSYHGVRKRRWGRWVSEIREPRKKSRIWLGSFPFPEMAAKAYDVAAYCLRGTKAQLNFPDEIDGLPPPSSTTTPRDIQLEAAKAARSVRKRIEAKAAAAAAVASGIDDFWEEIELPELKMGGKAGESEQGDVCGWSSMFAVVDAAWLDADS